MSNEHTLGRLSDLMSLLTYVAISAQSGFC